MSGYRFEVTDIEWPVGAPVGLPSSAHVYLPAWLVESDSINDQQWEDEINDELEKQFNARATDFGFEPDDEDDEADGGNGDDAS